MFTNTSASSCRRTFEELSRILRELRLQRPRDLARHGENIRKDGQFAAVPRKSDRDGTKRCQERHGNEPRKLSARLPGGSGTSRRLPRLQLAAPLGVDECTKNRSRDARGEEIERPY